MENSEEVRSSGNNSGEEEINTTKQTGNISSHDITVVNGPMRSANNQENSVNKPNNTPESPIESKSSSSPENAIEPESSITAENIYSNLIEANSVETSDSDKTENDLNSEQNEMETSTTSKTKKDMIEDAETSSLIEAIEIESAESINIELSSCETDQGFGDLKTISESNEIVIINLQSKKQDIIHNEDGMIVSELEHSNSSMENIGGQSESIFTLNDGLTIINNEFQEKSAAKKSSCQDYDQGTSDTNKNVSIHDSYSSSNNSDTIIFSDGEDADCPGLSDCKVNLKSLEPNCVVGCSNSNNSRKCSFITFPRDPSRFAEWVRAIKKPELLSMRGKKEAGYLLICSKHFSDNMWIHLSSGIRRLHKNAVPELLDQKPKRTDKSKVFTMYDSSSPAKSKEVQACRIKLGTGQQGLLRLRKVSTMLSESALRESIVEPPTFEKYESTQFDDVSGTTALEKELVIVNKELRVHLQNKCDYISKQKSLYVSTIAEGKAKLEKAQQQISILENVNTELFNKVKENNKTRNTVRDSKKSVGIASRTIPVTQLVKEQKQLKSMKESIQRLQMQLEKDKEIIHNLEESNRGNRLKEIEYINNADASQRKISSIEENLASLSNSAGELSELRYKVANQEHNFKHLLKSHITKQEQLQSELKRLKIFHKDTTESGKISVLNFAAKHLTPSQVSWLSSQLALKNQKSEFGYLPDNFKELCVSILLTSKKAYQIYEKTLGFPPVKLATEWSLNSRSHFSTAVNTLEVSLEEHECSSEVVSLSKRIKIDPQQQRNEDSDEKSTDEEDGMADEDEEMFASDNETTMEAEMNGYTTSRDQRRFIPNCRPARSVTAHFDVGNIVNTNTQEIYQTTLQSDISQQGPFEMILPHSSVSVEVGDSMPLLLSEPRGESNNRGSFKRIVGSARAVQGAKVFGRVIQS